MSDTTVGSLVNIYAVPAGTVITSATQALPAGAINLGEVTTDGWKWTRSTSTQDISTNNEGVTRKLIQSSEVTLAATLMDDNKVVREFIHGVKEGLNGEIAGDGKTAYAGGIVADSVDNQLPNGTTKVKRVFFPATQVTSTDDVVINSGSAVQYGFTATANAVNGKKYHEFNAVIGEEVTPPTGGNTGTISLDVVQGTDANGNTLVVSGTVTGATTDDGVSVTAQPASGPSSSQTYGLGVDGSFTVTLPISPIVGAGTITVSANTLPDSQATGSVQFDYVP
jgi:hypothetical protein